MSDYDFIGITYNGETSKKYGLTRVSDGSRYNENLVPNFNNKTQTVDGANETYYFGENFTQKEFNLEFAFDGVTEQNLRDIRSWLYQKEPKQLIFNEVPYKYYMAKASAPPSIKYICFEDGSGARVYKGEVSVNFVCYYPFGKSVYKWLNEYTSIGIDTSQWKTSSKLKECQKNYDTYSGDQIQLYNAGDLSTTCNLFVTPTGTDTLATTITINYYKAASNDPLRTIQLNNIEWKTGDNALLFDFKNRWILGATYEEVEDKKIYTSNSNFYNEYLGDDEWFDIEVGVDGNYIGLTNVLDASIDYQYIYY